MQAAVKHTPGQDAKSIYGAGSHLLFAVLIFGTTAAAAQVALGTATSADDQPTYQLRANVRRVYVDVVVTDHKGYPVKGLTSEDFQVFEDGVLQPKRGFDVHELKGADPETSDLKLDLPPNTFANLVSAPKDSPVTVILYDVLNTPIDAMPAAHAAMVKFIKDQKSSSRIAIFVLGSRLRMLQGFTDDETQLLEAINSKAAGTQQSSLLMTDTAASTANNAITADLPANATNILSDLKSLEATENTTMLRQRLETTVNAFAQIARFVSTLPGRKNLIWLSGSFPSGALPNGDTAAAGTANEFGDTYSLAGEVKEMENLLNVTHVVMYPVDVRGLQVDTRFSATSNTRVSPGAPPPSSFNTQQAAEHGTMDSVAESTGGRAFYNTNGLKEAMQSAIEEGSSYYTITYQPTNAKDDGTLRKIKVELRQPGYQLAYRRSYFANPAVHAAALAQEAGGQPEQDVFLQAGMQHGAPVSPELFFEASVNPVGGAMVATPAEMQALSEFIATKLKRGTKEPVATEPIKVQHYEVSYVILGRQLDLPPRGNGKYATNMTFALAAYSPDSLIVNGLEASVKNEIPEAQYQKIKAKGYHASLVFAVPVGATALRIAARDAIGNHMGTIEVPLPLPAVKSPPAATVSKQ